LLNQSQWTLATIIEDYAVKNRTRNKVILVPGNVQNAGFIPFKPLSIKGPRRLLFLLPILKILPPIQNFTDNTSHERVRTHSFSGGTGGH
jgi:hypothetical protein